MRSKRPRDLSEQKGKLMTNSSLIRFISDRSLKYYPWLLAKVKKLTHSPNSCQTQTSKKLVQNKIKPFRRQYIYLMIQTCQNSLRVAFALMTLKDIIFIIYITSGLLPFFCEPFYSKTLLYAGKTFAGKTSREKKTSYLGARERGT